MANSSILQSLMDAIGISVYRFEKEIGVGQSTLDKAIKRNSNISSDIIDKIVKRYDFVNRNWLETGVGEMYLPINRDTSSPTGTREKIYSQTREQVNRYSNTSQVNESDIEMAKKVRSFIELFQQVDDHEKRIKRIENHLNLS